MTDGYAKLVTVTTTASTEPPHTLAIGGQAPIGANPHMIEMEIGPGRRYDASRDVLVFMRYMILGITRALQDKDIPVLMEALDPKTEERVVASLHALLDTFSEDVLTTYDGFANSWLKRANDPEAADLLLKVFGRAIIQFYAECAINASLPDEEKKAWFNTGPDGLIAVCQRAAQATLFERKSRLSRRLEQWAVYRVAARFYRLFRRSGTSRSV